MAKLSTQELSENGAKGALAREKRSNKWIARREEKDREAIRERIQVGMLVTQLEKASKGEVDLSPTQVSAAKILLDKALPSLQAIETSAKEQFSELSDDELREQVRALITLHPWLLNEFRPGIQGDAGQQSTAQTTESSDMERKTA